MVESQPKELEKHSTAESRRESRERKETSAAREGMATNNDGNYRLVMKITNQKKNKAKVATAPQAERQKKTKTARVNEILKREEPQLR